MYIKFFYLGIEREILQPYKQELSFYQNPQVHESVEANLYQFLQFSFAQYQNLQYEIVFHLKYLLLSMDVHWIFLFFDSK